MSDRDHTYFLVLSKVYGCTPAVSRACTEIAKTFTESMERICSRPISAPAGEARQCLDRSVHNSQLKPMIYYELT